MSKSIKEQIYDEKINLLTLKARQNPDVQWAYVPPRGDKIPDIDKNFFGHSKVNKQNIVKNPPKQVPQLGKDRFYSNVKNRTGQL